ncbi:hypothetical protein [Streptomyces sp. NBC_01187]|uniref:SCO2584 family spore wall biosynthesis protein n=1 Tax=Streptomyces sp. NBC_01187 TaxID=2903766 RepID=UPI00386B1D09|nr:hypothetical protein OG220_12740 [Streptomyces sp. NBC_01187]
MPDDVGGQPFQDGEEPDNRDHGPADDEFASVVLDEDFVRSAEVHEPTAAERILAAAQSHAESEIPRILEEGFGYGRGEGEFPLDDEDPDDDEGRFDRSDYEADFPGQTPYADYDGYEGYDDEDGPDPGGPGTYDPAYGSVYGPFSRPGAASAEAHAGGFPPELDPAYEHGADFGHPHGAYGASGRFRGPYGAHGGTLRPYRGHGSWQRPIAWVLAVVMGIGMVALAFTAVYRGASSQRQEPTPPPATTGVDPSVVPGALPSVSADTEAPTASAEPPEG